jgi:serine/threonine-protein kinase
LTTTERACPNCRTLLPEAALAVGTPQYMAPEQATGEKDVDGRADLYAVGAMLYEMLTGAPPFTGANARSVLTKSLTEAPKRVSQSRPGVPEVLDPILERALAKSADDRFQTAQEFVAAMDAVRGTPTPLVAVPAISAPATQVTGAVAAPRGLRRWLTPVNLLVAVLAAAVLFFALRGRGSASGDDGSPRGNRLVVLPFDNKGGQNDLYLVEGISQQVRVRLNRLGALQVIAAGSSDQYRDSKKTLQDIGRELGADYILSADAQWAEADGGRLTVTPTLRDARSGKVRWEQTMEVPAVELAKTPTQIAAAVARELGAKPSEAERQDLERLPTANSEAYRSFLRGSFLTGADPETSRQSIREYEQAVALDAGFAQAWASLSSRYATLFANVSRTPANAERSKVALARAEELAPGSSFVRRARYIYLSNVVGDQAAAIAELDDMLRTYPNDAVLLATSATFDRERGELGTALAKLERARDLDPRQGNTLATLSSVYVALGRYPDAVQAGEALVAVRPRDLSSQQTLVIAHLASADLGGARAALKAGVQRGIPAPRMAAYMAAYQEVGFALEEAEQELVLRLTPSAFDDDRSWWAQSLATLHWQRGDTALARAFADSALAPTRELLAKAPEDLQQHGLLALMLAYLGRGAEARAEIERALPATDENNRVYNRVNAAKAELALGNREAATAHIAVFRKFGHFVTPGWMQVDPTYASLKGYPPFEQLIKAK